MLFHHSFIIYISIPKPTLFGFLFVWSYINEFCSSITFFPTGPCVPEMHSWCYMQLWFIFDAIQCSIEWIYHKFIYLTHFTLGSYFSPTKNVEWIPLWSVLQDVWVCVYFHVYLSKPRIQLLVLYILISLCVYIKPGIEF